jgi:V/A-type H+-transporting ATPase subunit C
VESPECHRILDHLPDTYGEVLCSAENPLSVENQLEEMTRRAASGALATARSALARAYAYLLLREDDIRRLLAVVRGKYFELPADVIRQAVFGVHTPPG